MKNKKNQEDIFMKKESDAWFERNISKIIQPAEPDHNVIKMIKLINLPKSTKFIDLGGSTGKVSAGILNLFPSWKGTVLEPSQKAIKKGSKLFPKIKFINGSLTKKKDMPKKVYDLAIICMVFSWIDRGLLSQAIANIDYLIKPGGYIIIRDFFSPHPRANKYHHSKGLFTYKQDYSLPFLSMNIYTELFKNSAPVMNSNQDNKDPYNFWTMNSILQKDLFGRYRKNR